MNGLTLAFAVLASGALQSPSPLGDDAAKFDQLLDAAYLHRDVAFMQAAVADDVRYGLASGRGAAVWNKQQLLADVRFYDGRERNVDDVRVDARGDLLQTSGHIQVKTLRADAPEYQLYYVRLYRRGATGWQLTSHEVVSRLDAARPTASLPPRVVRPGIEVVAPDAAPPPGVVRPGNGVTAPRLVRDLKPQYTADAMRAQIEGGVILEAVVGIDGRVGQVRIVRSLDRTYGLDEEAVKCAKLWQFIPGTRDGTAVPVLVTIEMTFTLGKK